MNDFKVSIVIPVYNHWDLVEQLVMGLGRYEKDSIDEIIVIDDFSTEGHVLDAFMPITYFRNQTNVGFTVSSNTGLALATQEENKIVFLISSDVKVSGKFIYQAEDILLGAKRSLIGNRHITFDTGWNTLDGEVFDYLEGWFLGATSHGWRDLGFFDPAYAPHDYEDVDLCAKANEKGYRLVSLNNPHITHMGAQSIGFNPEREAVTRKNREYFRRKWSR